MIKSYSHIHPSEAGLSFDIKRMEDIYDRMGGQPDEPHRHDFYTILLVKEAKGQHMIDFQTFELSGNQIYFISPGQVHQILEEQKSYGCAMTLSRQFLVENGIDASFIADLHLFQDYGYSPPLETDEALMQSLEDLTDQMYTFTYSDKKFKYEAVGALLKLFLIQCNNACSLSAEDNTQQVHASLTLLRNFKSLLNEHHNHWHKVNEYAEALHITADYLNASVKSLTGKSAKEHIQSRIIVAAKRMLRFSDMTAKEIAYELGFSEPANFSQFFKKCTGLSPIHFRQEIK
jgi:AraC-like DNA-binding protein